MNKYYLIPVTSPAIFIKGKTLIELLRKADEELYSREIKRRKLTYDNEHSKVLLKSGYLRSYNEETTSLYKTKGIPERLIIVSDDKGVREFITNEGIDFTNESYLEVFRVDSKEIQDFIFSNVDYENKVFNLIKKRRINIKKFFKSK